MVGVKSEVATSQSSDADEILLSFTKMQGLGNDFVVVKEEHLRTWLQRGFAGGAPSLSDIARKVCNRNFGIGADGLIVVSKSETCDIGWTYLNSDGSCSVMCGNGLRCVAQWCVANSIVNKEEFSIETGKGPIKVKYESSGRITTDLGEPILSRSQIPVGGEASERVVSVELPLTMRTLEITCVSMGNPHCVIFEPDFEEVEYGEVAVEIQCNPFFPQGVNVSFISRYDRTHADVVVWERGCGPTLACASAAAAVLVAGVLEDKLARRATIKLPGGPLEVEWSDVDNHVRITGPAVVTFTGNVSTAILEAVP